MVVIFVCLTVLRLTTVVGNSRQEDTVINNRIEFANSLRGIAALFVVASHVIGGFWFGRSAVSAETGLPPLPSDIQIPPWAFLANLPDFNLGAFGVGLFFLISGFVIPFSLARGGAGRFIISRTVRLFPTYVACFTIVLLAVAGGAAYFSVPYPFGRSEILYHYLPGLRAIMASRGIDGVVWTLEVEILFYLLCAGAAPLIRQRSKLFFLIPPIATAVFYLATQWRADVAPNLMGIIERTPYVDFLFVGTVFHMVYVKAMPWRAGTMIAAGLLAVWAFGWATATEPSLSYVWPNYLYALAVFVLCYNFPNLVPESGILRFFAKISYPLYLVHAVPGYVIMHILLDWGYPAEFATASAAVFAVSAATAIHFLVERPTHRLAAAIQRRPIAIAIVQPVSVSPPAPLASLNLTSTAP